MLDKMYQYQKIKRRQQRPKEKLMVKLEMMMQHKPKEKPMVKLKTMMNL